MKPGILCIVFFILCISAFAQVPDDVFHHITSQDGLSYNHVNCLLRDKRGFLWIGTVDGLNRYDGHHFKIFRKTREPNSLINNTIHGLAEDKSGNIWGATDRGVFCYHPKQDTFENYYDTTNINFPQIGNIIVDSNDVVWASDLRGLLRFDVAKHKFIRIDCPDNLKIENKLHIKRKGMCASPGGGNIWLATTSGLVLYVIKSGRFISYLDKINDRLFFNHEATCLRISPLGYLWYFDNKSRKLIGFDPDKLNIKYEIDLKDKILPGEIASIYEDKNRQLWLSSRGYEIYKIDYLRNRDVLKYNYRPEDRTSLAGDFFWDGYHDENGTMWLGTVGGISRSNKNSQFYKVYRIFENSPYRKSVINRIYINSLNEDVWWLMYLDGKLAKYLRKSNQLVDIPISVFKTKRGKQPHNIGVVLFNQLKTYVVAENGIWVNSGKFIQFDPFDLGRGLDTISIQNAVFDNNNNLYITDSRRLWKLSLSTGFLKKIPYAPGNKLNEDQIRINNLTMKGSKLWMICGNDVLGNVNEDDEIECMNVSNPAVKSYNGSYTGMKPDKTENLWIVRKGDGLFQFNIYSGKYTKYTQSDGLAMSHMIDAEIDTENRIWIAGFNQFSIFDQGKRTFHNFVLPLNENNFGSFNNRMVALKNGNIICTLGDKVVEFFPSRIKPTRIKSKPLISGILVNGIESAINDDHIILEAYENNVQFLFGILVDENISPYQMQYQLSGLGDTWNTTGSAFEAYYPKLPSGNYTFKVRAVAKDQSWVSDVTSVVLEIKTPFYKTTWFSSLLVLFGAFTIYTFYRYRIREVERTEQLKTEFNRQITEWRLQAMQAQMNPHFIFNCLNSINRYIIKSDIKTSSLYLTKFAKLIRLILDNSKHKKIPLSSELEALKLYLEMEAFRFENKFNFIITVDENVDVDHIELPPLVIQPYAENAIWHGLLHKEDEGKLSIYLKKLDGYLNIFIEDNGIGRDRSVLFKNEISPTRKSHGLKLTEDRLSFSDGSDSQTFKPTIIDLYNADGSPAGTKVIIKIRIHEETKGHPGG